jgi:hypothetical protein
MNNQKYSLKLIIAFLTSFVWCYTISLPLVVQAKPPVSPAPAQKKPPVSPAPAKQEPFTPSNIGKPDQTQPAGRRDDCMMGEKSLTALIPVTPEKLGLTIASRPTFFFYIPQTNAKDADFSLQDDKGKVVYKTTLKLPKTSGVISLPIPNVATAPELQVDKSYQWTFSLVCNAQKRADDVSVRGFIQRVNRPDLVAKVEKTALKQRPSVYAEAGIWHEMLTTLAELRRANPNDATLTAEWKSFLDSVGLKDVSQESLVRL